MSSRESGSVNLINKKCKYCKKFTGSNSLCSDCNMKSKYHASFDIIEKLESKVTSLTLELSKEKDKREK